LKIKDIDFKRYSFPLKMILWPLGGIRRQKVKSCSSTWYFKPLSIFL